VARGRGTGTRRLQRGGMLAILALVLAGAAISVSVSIPMATRTAGPRITGTEVTFTPATITVAGQLAATWGIGGGVPEPASAAATPSPTRSDAPTSSPAPAGGGSGGQNPTWLGIVLMALIAGIGLLGLRLMERYLQRH
jgi:hypothetical protein